MGTPAVGSGPGNHLDNYVGAKGLQGKTPDQVKNTIDNDTSLTNDQRTQLAHMLNDKASAEQGKEKKIQSGASDGSSKASAKDVAGLGKQYGLNPAQVHHLVGMYGSNNKNGIATLASQAGLGNDFLDALKGLDSSGSTH